MTFRDVRVDAFWSATICNRDGYLEPNAFDSCSSVTVTPLRARIASEYCSRPRGGVERALSVTGAAWRPHASVS